MAKKFCTRVDKCIRCGKCCKNLRKKGIFTEQEDLKVRKSIFEKKGILYIYPLDHLGLGITDEEKEILSKEAERFRIKLKIKPKKILIDDKNNIIVYDWFLDYKICPFYKAPDCTIYEKRPVRCREFPDIKDIDEEQLEKFLKGIRLAKIRFEDALRLVKANMSVEWQQQNKEK